MTAATISPQEVESVAPHNVAQSGCSGVNGCKLGKGPEVEEEERELEAAEAEVEEGDGEWEELDSHSRAVGDTEHSWCRAVDAGTGITVLALLFSEPLETQALQRALDAVQRQHPRLRSQLVWVEGRPAFRVSRHPTVLVEEVDGEKEEGGEEGGEGGEEGEGEDGERVAEKQPELWLRIVERELNTNIWPMQQQQEELQEAEAVPVVAVRLYRLPERHSLVILRVHTAACDRAAAAAILVQILRILQDQKEGEKAGGKGGGGEEEDGGSVENAFCGSLVAVEDAIPKGQANKPFWAHGVDLLGYSLGSRRHASLPFQEPAKPRRSELVVSSLPKSQTQELLEACSRNKTCLYGAISAAGLKAAAAVKQTGGRGEHYAVVSLVDCRQYLLQSALSDPTVGFYHSALMNTHHVTETTEFWELARRCSNSLTNAVKNRKHFTDMGDLNFLMCQAIQHPQLTPHCSLRTSLLVLFQDDIHDDLESLRDSLGLVDYLGCSSIHGVGPSLAVFHSIRNGSLHCANLYPAPLHSRSQMQTYVDKMMELLTSSMEGSR